MRPFILLLSVFLFSADYSFCQKVAPSGSKPLSNMLWKLGAENFPGKIPAFVENKGQYVNPIGKEKILFDYDYNGIMVLFTQKENVTLVR